MLKKSHLFAISPLDGRYRSKIKELEIFFSEFALIRYRLNPKLFQADTFQFDKDRNIRILL